MKHKLYIAFAFIALIFLPGCAQLPLLVTTGVANGLQYGIKDPVKRETVACQIRTVTSQASTITAVPDVAGFHALLEKYLPAGSTKELTETNLSAVYGAYYPTIKDKVPAAQLSAFKSYLDAADVGASIFCSAP